MTQACKTFGAVTDKIQVCIKTMPPYSVRVWQMFFFRGTVAKITLVTMLIVLAVGNQLAHPIPRAQKSPAFAGLGLFVPYIPHAVF